MALNKGFGGITASFLISLFSTAPVLIVKQLYYNSKPKIEQSSTEEILVDDDSENENEDEDDDALDGGTSTKRGAQLAQLRMSTTLTDALSVVQKNKMNTTIRQVNIALRRAQKNKSRTEKIALAESVRHTLYDSMYPLPRWGKKVAWTILILWSFACALIAVAYGIQFDLLYTERQDWL